jgi:uncharacterized protein YbjT (DUF2867 family)
MKSSEKSIVMMGATGAVGRECLKTLLEKNNITRISLLGRRAVENINNDHVEQYEINIFKPATYDHLLAGHNVAICTLGVGEPSKISREEFIKIDKTAVLDFAKACKKAGINHFELLSSVSINAKSSQYYLRIKGELVEELKALNFDRLSIFQPSMILTPTNRYGLSQAIVLTVWPLISPMFLGNLNQFKGVKVEQLGKAIAENIFTEGSGLEYLKWADFQSLSSEKQVTKYNIGL